MNTTAKRTPGPYTVEKDPVFALMGGRGSRNGKKWRVVHNGRLVLAVPFQTTALDLAEDLNRAAFHRTFPWKVEAWGSRLSRSFLIGRAMFKTREEADAFADGAEGAHVLASQPGDTEFA
jgi:hypothetical protein